MLSTVDCDTGPNFFLPPPLEHHQRLQIDDQSLDAHPPRSIRSVYGDLAIDHNELDIWRRGDWREWWRWRSSGARRWGAWRVRRWDGRVKGTRRLGSWLLIRALFSCCIFVVAQLYTFSSSRIDRRKSSESVLRRLGQSRLTQGYPTEDSRRVHGKKACDIRGRAGYLGRLFRN